MDPETTLTNIPDIVLIIGTDAAGKDHVANIVEQIITEAGGRAEKRKRFLCGRVTRDTSSAGKNPLELILEKGFLLLFPYVGFILPWVLTRMLRRDISRYRKTDGKVVVVGHNCLRGLAFYWGHKHADPDRLDISPELDAVLKDMRLIEGMRTLVLNVDDEVRKERIRKRARKGEADVFDLYMAEHSEISEHVEDILIRLSRQYLDAELIENNDLSETELRDRIVAAFRK